MPPAVWRPELEPPLTLKTTETAARVSRNSSMISSGSGGLAFVAQGNTDVGNELAAKRGEWHGGGTKQLRTGGGGWRKPGSPETGRHSRWRERRGGEVTSAPVQRSTKLGK